MSFVSTYAPVPETAPTSGGYTCTGRFAAAAYELREIRAKNRLVDKFMGLHKQVLKSLPGHGRHWVKPKDTQAVRDHLKNGHIALGVFAGRDMVGQVLLTFPDLPGGRNLKGYPIGEGNGLLPPTQCMVIQTLGVSPGHQGKGIRTLLLGKAEEIAHRKYRRHLLAKTDVKNEASVRGFTAAGYIASGETSVMGEEYTCVFMYKPLQSVPSNPAVKLHFGTLKA